MRVKSAAVRSAAALLCTAPAGGPLPRRGVQVISGSGLRLPIRPQAGVQWPASAAAPRRSVISFADPQAYERMTGTWSRLVGEAFLAWLAPAPGLRWLDAGCGNGVFTRLIVERCAPTLVEGLDPEPAQIDDARRRLVHRDVRFSLGSALAMPYPDASYDIAAMALVLPFLPEPIVGVREMLRVLRPGGVACAYNWDLQGGGSPLALLGKAMRDAGVPAPPAPSVTVSGETAVRRLWKDAGLHAVQTSRFTVRRRYDNGERAWQTSRLGASTAGVLDRLPPDKLVEVKARYLDQLQQDPRGPVKCTATAIAVKGLVTR